MRTLPIHVPSGFWQDQRGAAALEAAIVVPVFLLLVFMIIQIGLMLAVQTMLDNATRAAARLIAIGQVQTSGGKTSFANQLCNGIGSFVSCSGLQYTVLSGAKFSGLSTAVAVDPNGNLTNTQFAPGGPGDDVLVEVAYNFPMMFPWLQPTAGGWLLISSVAFQNELYQ